MSAALAFTSPSFERRGSDEPDGGTELLERIAGGSRSAMDMFYRQYSARVHRFAMARLGDSVAAADVVSDVMMKVWLDAKRYRGESRVSTWLFGIAFHCAMDVMRKRYRQATDALDEEMSDPDAVDADDWLLRMEDVQRVRVALTRLSERHRAVLHLVFYGDLSYSQVSRILGIPQGTVKTRVFHAKQRLKKYVCE